MLSKNPARLCAALAGMLLPMALPIAPAIAGAIPYTVGLVSITAGTGAQTGLYDYNYSLTTTGSSVTLTEIELPEVVAGSFVVQTAQGFSQFDSGQFTSDILAVGTPGLPSGWSEGQVTTSDAGNPQLKPSGAPAAFIDVTGSSFSLSSGTPFNFTLYATTNLTTNAQATLAISGVSGFTTIDPPVPAPEPASMTILGGSLLALLGVRRRKRG
jgi:hypothetical protein